jgi:putative membrane protein
MRIRPVVLALLSVALVTACVSAPQTSEEEDVAVDGEEMTVEEQAQPEQESEQESEQETAPQQPEVAVAEAKASPPAPDDAQQVSMSGEDAAFLREAASIGLAQIEGANVALDKATDPEVMTFAREMLTDHERSSEELRALAERNGLDLPTESQGRWHREIETLKGRSGPDFDKAYAKAAVKAHEEAITLYKRAARRGDDEEVRGLAETALEKLENHLDMAQAMVKAVAANAKVPVKRRGQRSVNTPS